MFHWISQFFQSLPEWYWVLMYAVPTYVGLRWWTGEASGRIKLSNEGRGAPTFFGFLAIVVTTMVSAWIAFPPPEVTMCFVGYPRSIGFQMMAIGLDAFILRTAGDFLVPRLPGWYRTARSWCVARYRDRQAQLARDPDHILEMCRRQFDDAKRRHTVELELPIEEMLGFDQAGENALKLLEQLFQLVEHIDEVLAFAAQHPDHLADADAIFAGTHLEKFLHLFGPDGVGVDRAAFANLRTQAQGVIEGLVLLFKELPTNVAALNVTREAAGIEGFQADLAALLPKTSSASGLMADFETGRLQERLINALATKAKARA
jgi:hypothetical protein